MKHIMLMWYSAWFYSSNVCRMYNARPLAKWNGGHWRLLRLRSLPLCEVKWLGFGHTHGSAHFCSWCRCLILWWVVGKGKWRDHQAAGARWGMQYVMYPSIHPPPDRHIMQTRQSNELAPNFRHITSHQPVNRGRYTLLIKKYIPN